MSGLILALSGGVGGAKLSHGLTKVAPPDELAIVVNTADDFDHLGLHISPDLDTVLYTLADLANPEMGWGRRDETWLFLETIEDLGGDTWFRLGDRDLAMHVLRTARLRSGEPLSTITADFARRLGLFHPIMPMTDDAMRTIVVSGNERLDFQNYFVRRRCAPPVDAIEFQGSERARPSSPLATALDRLEGGTVIVCPSNPFVSVLPILTVPGIFQALSRKRTRVVAVSPIVGGAALKGPAAKMMVEFGLPPTVVGIAEFYGDLLDGLVIDEIDARYVGALESLGLAVLVTRSVMSDAEDRRRLSAEVLEFARSLPPRIRDIRYGAHLRRRSG